VFGVGCVLLLASEAVGTEFLQIETVILFFQEDRTVPSLLGTII
jgi:hypothetical protein